MKAGDKLYEKIDTAIRDCKVGVVVLSPRYCESLYCLHELALSTECQKRVIPIFYNVKPAQLRVGNKYDGTYVPEEKLERFRRALEEAKDTLGFRFDSSRDIGQSPTKCLQDITEQIAQSS
ncbi:TIR-only protein-like [Juglans microcarpa x Juglans regia]|uniref:TIR-only protein-like n=1 Tax=Juglans microcarpa x Juglans regia TaxID=2249226 RepID=UPI001B7E7E5E|nr:TIR-only protein-like [Juglans microcarpa x Juglans regia]